MIFSQTIENDQSKNQETDLAPNNVSATDEDQVSSFLFRVVYNLFFCFFPNQQSLFSVFRCLRDFQKETVFFPFMVFGQVFFCLCLG